MQTIELELDENGSPVTLEAAAWYVCFVPGLKKQWWHAFVNARHKHVFAMKPAGPGEWTLLEPWWHRLLTATITSEQARKFSFGAPAATFCMFASSSQDKAASCAGG